MSLAFQAVLLSAFVFPGAGHFLLKRYLSGTLFLGCSLICLLSLFSLVFDISQQLSQQILNGELAFSVLDISSSAMQMLSDSGSSHFRIASIWFAMCWLLSIVDAYRIGSKVSPTHSA